MSLVSAFNPFLCTPVEGNLGKGNLGSFFGNEEFDSTKNSRRETRAKFSCRIIYVLSVALDTRLNNADVMISNCMAVVGRNLCCRRGG